MDALEELKRKIVEAKKWGQGHLTDEDFAEVKANQDLCNVVKTHIYKGVSFLIGVPYKALCLNEDGGLEIMPPEVCQGFKEVR